MFLKKLIIYLERLWLQERPLCVVWLGVFIYTAFFSTISFLRYEAFSYSDFDFAIFVHEAWKAIRGSGQISLFNDVPIWGNALELISFVTAPIYFLFGQNPKSLLFLQSLALGASAIPVFLIARRRMAQKVAACLAIAYLFYPSIWYANLYEYNPLVYATFTLLMAFYFLQGERFGLFMLFVFLSIINRADLGIVTVMFGVYAFFERKPWKWVIWPSLISIVWVGIGLLVIIPNFKGDLSYDSMYPQFGKGFDQIIRNMIFHPEILWNSLTTAEDAQFIFQVLYPVGFFSLLGIKEFLICILSLVQHLASVRYQEHTIVYHYTSTITPFVFISAAYGLARIVNKREVTLVMCAMPIVLSLLANGFYGPINRFAEYKQQLHKNDEDDYKRKLLQAIPGNVPVVSSFEFSPMLAGRNKYYSFHYIYSGFFTKTTPYKTPQDIEYALINFEDPRLMSFYRNGSDQRIRDFIKDGQFGVVDKINAIVLFKRNHVGLGPISNIELVNGLTPKPLARADNGAQIFKVDARLINKRGFNVLNLTFRWGVLNKITDEFLVTVTIFDRNKNRVYTLTRQHNYGYYPASIWTPEKLIMDEFDLLVPKAIKAGEYEVYVALLSVSKNRYIPLKEFVGDALSGESIQNLKIANFQI